MIIKVISGGQTGADQAGLDAAIANGVMHGGMVPKGRRTESGPLDSRYNMMEHTSKDYPPRTKFNVQTSQGTVVFTYGPPETGSALTVRLAVAEDKPVFLGNLFKEDEEIADALYNWCRDNDIEVLNVAGSRGSKYPEIYDRVFNILDTVLYNDR